MGGMFGDVSQRIFRNCSFLYGIRRFIYEEFKKSTKYSVAFERAKNSL